MSISKNFYRNELDESNAILFSVPVNKKAIIRSITVVNTSGSSRTYKVYLVGSGSTASDSNALIDDETISANTRADYNTWKIVGEKGSIQGFASGAGVTLHIDGAIVNE